MRRAAFRVVAACLLAAGCRTLPVPVPVEPGDERPAQLLAALAQRAGERHSLRGLVRVALDGPRGAARSNQVVVLQEPARLRVEVLGFLDQTAAVLVTDGERFELLRVQERRIEEGEVYPGLLWDVAQVDLEPEEAVQVLLGVPQPPPGLRVAAAQRLGGGKVRVDLADAQGSLRRRLEFARDGTLLRAEARNLGGLVLWEARYQDYRATSGVSFAHAIELRFPASGTLVGVGFRSVELNPELPDSIFALRLSGAASGAQE